MKFYSIDIKMSLLKILLVLFALTATFNQEKYSIKKFHNYNNNVDYMLNNRGNYGFFIKLENNYKKICLSSRSCRYTTDSLVDSKKFTNYYCYFTKLLQKNKDIYNIMLSNAPKININKSNIDSDLYKRVNVNYITNIYNHDIFDLENKFIKFMRMNFYNINKHLGLILSSFQNYNNFHETIISKKFNQLLFKLINIDPDNKTLQQNLYKFFIKCIKNTIIHYKLQLKLYDLSQSINSNSMLNISKLYNMIGKKIEVEIDDLNRFELKASNFADSTYDVVNSFKKYNNNLNLSKYKAIIFDDVIENLPENIKKNYSKDIQTLSNLYTISKSNIIDLIKKVNTKKNKKLFFFTSKLQNKIFKFKKINNLIKEFKMYKTNNIALLMKIQSIDFIKTLIDNFNERYFNEFLTIIKNESNKNLVKTYEYYMHDFKLYLFKLKNLIKFIDIINYNLFSFEPEYEIKKYSKKNNIPYFTYVDIRNNFIIKSNKYFSTSVINIKDDYLIYEQIDNDIKNNGVITKNIVQFENTYYCNFIKLKNEELIIRHYSVFYLKDIIKEEKYKNLYIYVLSCVSDNLQELPKI